jgi:hypothetical protein
MFIPESGNLKTECSFQFITTVLINVDLVKFESAYENKMERYYPRLVKLFISVRIF